MPEICFKADAQHLAVLDGYCSAAGKNRTTVMNDLLAQWATDKLHEATVVCRVAGVNPMAPESGRK